MSELETVVAECRKRWDPDAPAAARRLFHGRGHCYEGLTGLTVDRFGSVLVVGCFDDRTERAREAARLLGAALPEVTGICLQHRQGRGNRTTVLAGEVPEEVEIEEDALRYLVAPLRNQNVGLFLDMAPTRAWLRRHAEGRRVLNLFAYTCAFSVAALAGGATGVVNVDMSRPALDWGLRNHRLNGQDPRLVSMLAHNLFKSWQKLKSLGPFDLVIIDPPTNQRGSFNAEKQYGQVLKRLPDLAAPGADVIAALNSPFLNTDFLTGQMARWCPAARFQEAMPVSEDFPDRFPERGLKIARFRYG
ncbi:MAG: class I SAM-dependent methyltransferase [Pseudomonadales bacterium]